MRTTAFLANIMLTGIMLVANAVGATPKASASPSPQAGPQAAARVARAVVSTKRPLATASPSRVDAAEPWASQLGSITITNRSTNVQGSVALYDAHGVLDRGAARAFMRIAGRTNAEPDDASEDDERLDLRVVQLAIRASYHFAGAPMRIISATRPGSSGRHGTGEALDFALDGVKASVLAKYLRGTPRAGVGIYTHRKTQYVHLDVREQSYHWIDGSPPGVKWRERHLSDPKQAVRDASWSASLDLPEH